MMMDTILQRPMPEFDIPKEMAIELGDMDVGKKVSASINYEVVSKDEYSTVIAINWISFKKSKQIT